MSDTLLQDRLVTQTAKGSYLAEVVSVQDPESLSRVQIRLLSFDQVGNQDAEIWARVAVPFAGENRGAFMIPDVGDEVLILHESVVSDSATIDDIFDIVHAILTLTETGGTVTTDGNEQNLYINNAPAGVFAPEICQVAFPNPTAVRSPTTGSARRGRFQIGTWFGDRPERTRRTAVSTSNSGVPKTPILRCPVA